MAKTTRDTTRTTSTVNLQNNSLTQVKKTEKNLSSQIVPIQLTRIRQNVKTWRDAIVETEFAYFPHRVKMQQLFIDTKLNGHVSACIERRKDLTLLRKFQFSNKAGEADQKTMDLFTTSVNGKIQALTWFNNFISYALDAEYFGYSLIALGDIMNNAFPDLNVVRRWDISPDRLVVTTFPYQPSGMKFMEDPYRKWHVWVTTPNDIGTSKCGYGLLYKVGIYEIYLRNLFGYNADFIEMFAQPYRVGKTTKTEEKERAEFAQAIADMGSNGWALIDPVDQIQFLETALAGTGYKSYDNFESRLNKLISKVILGHADAMDSTPGKLGSSDGEFAPGQKAIEDKQTKDGATIESIINDTLLPRMRELGFGIPDDINFGYKNDAEVMQNANSVADISVKVKNAGLLIDPGYFTQETGIKVTAAPVASPFGGPASGNGKEGGIVSPSIKKKVAALYTNRHNHVNGNGRTN